uniref:Peptidase_M14 domain-containing protein n=1 Tax=Caenorhabditis japonica TaxID=281687 RepID=A0A8R1DFR7_CAEJA
MTWLLLLCLWACHVSGDKRIDYSGYTVHRFQVDTSSNTMEKLESFDMELDETTKTARLLLDVWAEPSKSNPYADVLVAPEFLSKFKSMLTASELATLKLLEGDIQSQINAERHAMLRNSISRRRKRSLMKSWTDFDTNSYHSYEEMMKFMKLLGEQKSDMVEVLKVATSSEGRTIYGVKIHPPGASPPEKPSIIVDAGVHAREWIAPAVALFLIRKIVSEYGSNPRVTANLDKFDWYIVPQVNPDGYEYSRISDRLWRKTRSKNTTVNRWCMGADANRNWGYRWGEAGANRTPCSNIYMGSHPYSEPEIRGLKDFFTWQIANPMVYISLHSYGQLLLSPWGYTNERTENYQDQQSAAREAAQAIKNTTGVSYSYGTISEMMYPASGTSIDFMQHRGVPYIYGVELRPTDNPNSFAFNLPPSYIRATGDEMLAALNAIGDHAVKIKRL